MTDKLPDLSADGLTPVPIVAIGASAGGEEAFIELLQHLLPTTELAYVYVQHQSPTPTPRLLERLGQATTMPVREARHLMRIDANHVYVLPPDQSADVTDGLLMLVPQPRWPVLHQPIDQFFTSLAESRQAGVVAILLPALDGDGMQGLKAVRANGGFTFAQDSTAQFQSLPRSTIAEDVVDQILSPAAIAHELDRLSQLPDLFAQPAASDEPDESPLPDEHLKAIITYLRRTTGVDFTHYKHTTIRRRIVRRMMLQKIQSPKAYLTYLRQHTAEATALYADLLINITAFFRDTETMDYVNRVLLPQLIREKPPGEPLRIWIPACSTGQEAYSMAMMAVEVLGEQATQTSIQIFATDLSESAITKARTGSYSPGELTAVSPRRLQQFFTKTDEHYLVNKSIRDLCVFAPHNLFHDPPFAQLHLISCRNLLIYLDTTLQRRALATFHHALNPGGFLLLGKSETVGSASTLFTQPEKDYKIYARRNDTTRRTDFDRQTHPPTSGGEPDVRAAPVLNDTKVHECADSVLDALHEAAVVLDTELRIQHANRAFYELFDLAPEATEGRRLYELDGQLWPGPDWREMLDQVLLADKPIQNFELTYCPPAHQPTPGGEKRLSINARRVAWREGQESVLLAIRDCTEQQQAQLLLAEREAWFRTIADNAPAPTWVADANDRYTFFNRAWLDYVGRPLNDELARDRALDLHPDDRDEYQNRYQQHVPERTPFQADYRLRRHDGEYRWMLENARPTVDTKGHFTGYIGSTTDVHLQKTATQELDRRVAERTDELGRANDIMRAALSASQAGISQWNWPYGITIWDEWGQQLMGFTDRQATQPIDRWYNRLHPNDRDRIQTLVQACARTGQAARAEFRVIRDDGSIRYVLGAWQMNSGGPNLVGLVIDISDLRQAEAALHQQTQEQLRVSEEAHSAMLGLFSQAPTALAIFMGPDLRIELANEKVLAIWGRTREQVMHKPLADALPEAEEQGFAQLMTQVRMTRQRFSAHEMAITILRSGQLETAFVTFVYEPYYNVEGELIGVIMVANEVTQYVLSRRRIEQTASQLQRLIENIPDLITRWDRELRLTFANEAFAQRAGQPLIGLLGKTSAELGQPDYISEAYMAKLQRTFDTRQPQEHYDAFPTPPGISLYHARLVPEFSSDGSVDTVLAVARDVTDLQRTQELARQTAGTLQSVLDASQTGVILLDIVRDNAGQVVDLRCRAVNSETERITGESMGSLVGQSLTDRLLNSRRADIFEHYRRVAETGQATRFEVQFENSFVNGWFDVSIRRQGEQLLVTFLDISAIRQAEGQVRQTARNLQAALNNSPAAIGFLKRIVTRADKPESASTTAPIVDFRLVVANENFARLLGKPLDELIDLPVSQLKSLLWGDDTFSTLERISQTDDHVYEERPYSPGDQVRWYGVSATRYDAGIVLMCLDITDLKQVEQQQDTLLKQLQNTQHTLVDLEQIRQQVRERGEFLRQTSHDLRGSFGVIQGAAHMLDLSDTEEERAYMLDMLQRNLQQVTQLLTQLLDYSRLESGQETVITTHFDVAELLRGLSESVAPLASERQLWVRTEGPAQLLVNSDTVKVRRIVQNLVLNALKYTQTGGVILTWQANSDEWLIQVSDTGPGLSQTQVQRLTSVPVAQPTTDLPTKGKEAGEGIGLLIVSQLISLLQAKLAVQTQPGEGTQFTISFPSTVPTLAQVRR